MSLDIKLSGSSLTTVPVPGLAGSGAPWALKEAAMKGSADIGSLHIDDPAATLTPQAFAPLRVTESEATPTMVAAGYLAGRNCGRGKTSLQMGNQREWTANVTDLNVLLSDRIIQTGGKRSAETDIVRIDWLLASGYLPLGDAGFIDRSSPTSLPAADYTGRTASDVLAECSNLSGKNYFVRWEAACTVSDATSPWAQTTSAAYVAPVGLGQSSVDLLGGTYDLGDIDDTATANEYTPAASIYAVASTYVASNDTGWGLGWANGSWPGAPNSGACFGVAGTAPAVVLSDIDCYWTVDLLAAGLPKVATVGINGGCGGADGGWANGLTVEASDNGSSWSVVVTLKAMAYGVSGGGFFASIPSADQGHRYWRVHYAEHSTGGGAHGGGVRFDFIALWGLLPSAAPALCYHAPLWSGDSSTISLSNDPAEIDHETVFAIPPSAELIRDPSRIFSGCHFEYSGGAVYVSDPAVAASYFADERFGRDTRSSDLNCTTAAAATALATAYLLRAATEEATLTGVILQRMQAAQVNLARQGQRIWVKLTHEPGFETGAWMQITHRTVAPFAPGLYDVSLDLAIPVLTGFNGGGFGVADPVRPAPWVRNFAQITAPAPADLSTALPGQRVAMMYIRDGDGASALVTLGCAYTPGSVTVQVDGQPVAAASITETSPTAGTVTLDFAPAGASGSIAAQSIAASWQVA